MNNQSLAAKIIGTRWVLSLAAILVILIVACGTAATATPQAPAATNTPAPAATSAPGQPTATAVPQPTATPSESMSGRDEAIVVTEAEPASVGGWAYGCSAEIHSMGCAELTVDPIGWIDSDTYEVVMLSGFTGYEQIEPNRWRYTLREGVKFHNGKPWTPEASLYGFDYNSRTDLSGNSATHTGGGFHGELVPGEPMKVDVVCDKPCPIYPRASIFDKFLEPEWYQAASEEEQNAQTISFGPYTIAEWVPGVHTKFDLYQDYVPSEAYDGQMPTIPHLTHVYRSEPSVRASMLATGEADWAADIGFDEIDRVPVAKTGTTTEVYALIPDLMWHPELKKKKVRQALAHAINCKELLDSLFEGQIQCHGLIAPPGTVGVTPENSQPYEYDPDLSRQLLDEAGYDPSVEININSRPGSNIRGPEILEAVATYWRDVGVNTNINLWSDLGKAREIQLSGCGVYSEEPGYKENLDCEARGPAAPYYSSSHVYEIATSSEILDLQRQGFLRMGCFSRSSRVCFPDLQKQIETAAETAVGPERTRLMNELGNRSHEEVYHFPLFAVKMVYGLSNDVEWKPNYSPRFRGNTMHFK